MIHVVAAVSGTFYPAMLILYKHPSCAKGLSVHGTRMNVLSHGHTLRHQYQICNKRNASFVHKCSFVSLDRTQCCSSIHWPVHSSMMIPGMCSREKY